MKNPKVVVPVASLLFCASPIFLLGWTELENAEADGAKMKMTFAVVDNDGHVVSNAWIQGGMYCDTGVSMGTDFGGYTDKTGRFTISGKTTGRVVYSVTKDDCYPTTSEFNFMQKDKDYSPTVRKGKWQPYGLTKTVTLKRMKDPCVKNWQYGKIISVPLERWVGIDLEKMELCSPYGNGIHQDAVLRCTDSTKETGWRNRHGSMELAFTNQPYAGVYLAKKDNWSEFKSVYVANTNDAFALRQFVYEHAREPERILKNEEFPTDSYVVFRTRTKVDDRGRLVSAHYGKLYGPWGYGETIIRFESVLFNSTPNDPNLEEEETAVNARLHIKGMRERGELK